MTTALFNGAEVKKIGKAAKAWQDEMYSCHKELKTKYETLSGFAINPLYTPQDLQGWDYLRDLGFPGRGAVYTGGPSHKERNGVKSLLLTFYLLRMEKRGRNHASLFSLDNPTIKCTFSISSWR